jgi:hypothetical protein
MTRRMYTAHRVNTATSPGLERADSQQSEALRAPSLSAENPNQIPLLHHEPTECSRLVEKVRYIFAGPITSVHS